MDTQGNNQVWVVIPVYNNAGTIRDIACASRAYVDHVLIVDDGSTDVDLRKQLQDLDVTVLSHDENRGKGAALLSAMQHVQQAGGSFMITQDGDGQHYPDDLPAFLSRLMEDTILIGAREHVVGEMPGQSRFGRCFSDFWVWLETGIPLRDTQSGFRAYPLKHLSQLPLKCTGYDFEIEVLVRAAWAGLRFETVPVKVQYEPPEKRVSSFRPFLDNLRISLTHSRLIGRRLWPWPVQRLVSPDFSRSQLFREPRVFLRRLLEENATARGLAVSAWFGVFLGALPLIGIHMLTILYVSMRLRLNKVMALSIQNICMPPLVPGVCIAFGYFFRHHRVITEASLIELGSEPVQRLWEWGLGSLVVAPALATVIAILVYTGVRGLQTEKSCKIADSE